MSNYVKKKAQIITPPPYKYTTEALVSLTPKIDKNDAGLTVLQLVLPKSRMEPTWPKSDPPPRQATHHHRQIPTTNLRRGNTSKAPKDPLNAT